MAWCPRASAFRLGGPGLGLDRRSSPAAAQRCAGGAGLDGTDEPQAILEPARMQVALTVSVE
jgi:hypothetical protein